MNETYFENIKIIKPLGSGKYGIVYLVEDTITKKKYAIKIENVINNEPILPLKIEKEFADYMSTKYPLQFMKIFKYEYEISRAGYENLATDIDSVHSLATYYNYCLSKTTLPWIFKWDADFSASSNLIDYLNNNTWEKNIILKLFIL
jgi:serine/threonine protein kinase